MPHLRLHCPELATKQKKLLAKELTEAAMRSFDLPAESRNRCTVQFMHFELADIAVGGKLLSESGEPDYHLEVTYRTLTEAQKQAFVSDVTPRLVRLLNLNPRSWLARLLRINDPPLFRISILFNEYSDDNYAVGGKFLGEVERRDIFAEERREFIASRAADNSL